MLEDTHLESYLIFNPMRDSYKYTKKYLRQIIMGVKIEGSIFHKLAIPN